MVIEARNELTNEDVALKYVSKSLLKGQREYLKIGRKMTISTALDDVRREIALMKKLSHSRIVKLFEVVDDPESDRLFLVMELVKDGEVMSWDTEEKRFRANPRLIRVEGGSGFEMSEECARAVFRDVLIGLDYLHRVHVVHRDLKPQNFLLTRDTAIRVKITDFGVSHVLSCLETGEEEKLSRTKGTYPFLAPECMHATPFEGYKADVWALGVSLHCFLTGRLPYWHEGSLELFDIIQNQPVNFYAVQSVPCSEGSVNILKRLMDKSVETRLGNARAVIDAHDEWLGEFVLQEDVEVDPVTDAELNAALTQTVLSVQTIANLKIFVQKWRNRATSTIAKKKQDELRRSISEGDAHHPETLPAPPPPATSAPNQMVAAQTSSSDYIPLALNDSMQDNKSGLNVHDESHVGRRGSLTGVTTAATSRGCCLIV